MVLGNNTLYMTKQQNINKLDKQDDDVHVLNGLLKLPR